MDLRAIDRRKRGDRRRRPTKPVSRYMWIGRRKENRRESDRNAHVFVDRYDHYLLLSFLVILVLSILDTYFTIMHIERGAREINPFMHYLLGHGTVTFFVVKYLLTALGLLALCICKNLISVRRIFFGIILVYLAVFVYHISLIPPP